MSDMYSNGLLSPPSYCIIDIKPFNSITHNLYIVNRYLSGSERNTVCAKNKGANLLRDWHLEFLINSMIILHREHKEP